MLPRARYIRHVPHLPAIALSLVLVLATTMLASASPNLLQISSDPYTAPGTNPRSEVEPDTFAFGSTIVSAFQVGRIYNGGAANIGFATSTNGGTTWTSGFLPATTPYASPAGHVYARVSDPSVAYDARHAVWLVSYLGLFPNGTAAVDVLVSRSVDGLTWSSPVVINNDGHFNDKNWTTCDNTASSPFYGHCYTEYDDNTRHDLIQMSTSADGGLTWGAGQSTQNNDHGLGGQPVVQPNGNVVVTIMGFSGSGFLTLAFTSSDGGASWGKTTIVAKIASHTPAGGIRADFPLPTSEVDAAGRVYVVWSDCTFEPNCGSNDLVLSTSTDGLNWSAITRLPLDPIGSGVDHFIPGLGVDRTTSGSSAHLAVAFYDYPVANCTTATCRLFAGAATSADGGATWTATTQLAGPMALTWLPKTTQGYMVGDYLSAS
ncbi:MAG TPA: sialidase family protein, partial [Anaerolineae bacterium]